MPNYLLWIVVPVYERADCINTLLHCLESQTYQNFKLVIVDHGKESLNIKTQSKVIWLRGSPKMWWTGAINHGLRYILDQDNITNLTPVLILNDDVSFDRDYISTIIRAWGERDSYIIGSTCVKKGTQTIEYSSIILKRGGTFKYKNKGNAISEINKKGLISSDLLSGRGTLIPINVFRTVGVYNEVLLPHYGADYEFVYRAKKKGFSVYTSTDAIVYAKRERIYTLGKDLRNTLNTLFNRKSRKNLRDLFFFLILIYGIFNGSYYFLKRVLKLIKASFKADE